MSAYDAERLARLAGDLRGLHSGAMLVLPNVWDVGSARVVEGAGYPAVATASAAVTAVLGHEDGDVAPADEMFAAAARIARAVSVPVSMDAEAGYGLPPAELVDRLLSAGVVGCNLEDSDHVAGGLVDAERHAAYLAEVWAACAARAVPVVLNARVDVFLPPAGVPADERVDEALRRARLYREAGADCIYPIGVADPDVLSRLVAGIDGPVNGNAGPDLPLALLRDFGVARVSYGPRFYRTALADLGRAVRLLADE